MQTHPLFSAICLVGIATTAHGQQPTPPFLGTWKFDLEQLDTDMQAAGMPAHAVAQRLPRLAQSQWVFGADGQMVIVTDGFPARGSWKTVDQYGDTYRLRLTSGGRTDETTLSMTATDKLRISLGENRPDANLVRFSEEQDVAIPEPLQIGSTAPALEPRHQLSSVRFDGKFEEGHIYLLEFWATWCPPCIEGLPALDRMQREHAARQVHVFAISSEERETVQAFLDRQAPASLQTSEAKTYGDLVSRLVVLSDPDNSILTDYLVATDQRAIPMTFLVGKSGLIEWYGNDSQEAKLVLERLIAEDWDRDAFSQTLAGRNEVQAKLPTVRSLMEEGKHEEAIALIDELIPLADRLVKEQLQQIRQAAAARADKQQE